MVSTPVVDAEAVFTALEKWIKQRPKLDPANYGLAQGQTPDRKQWFAAWKSYRAELRDISKDRKRAMTALREARFLAPQKPELLADAFRSFSGRLAWNGLELEYCTGQYFPTEYRKAAASVLETYIADWRRWYASENPQSFTYYTVDDVREANDRIGGHYFDRDTMRFFRSRIASQLYGGRYFVTSEQFDDRSPRLYSVREALPDGSIKSASEFQEFRTAAQAVARIRELMAR